MRGPKIDELSAVRDTQTVTPDGEPVGPKIAGVLLRPAVTQIDERGELVEVFSPAWAFHPEPLVYVYQAMIRPGKIKGWVMHRHQSDRIFASLGTMQWVLYDARQDSPTHGQVAVIHLGARRRALLVIPPGIFHAVQNIGQDDAYFVNLPTRAYDHAQPDKHRLPLNTERIPYRFSTLGK